jgi:hypothetical protein
MRLKRYKDYINESIEYGYRKELEEFPEIVRLIDLAVERTYEEVESGMKILVQAYIDKGYIQQVMHYLKSDDDDMFYVLVDYLATAYEIEDSDLYFSIRLLDGVDKFGNETWLPENDERVVVLKDTLRYEFPEFDIR